ncbi:hypothetical protein [Actinophytocola oryzae]|uniref:NifU-like protein n=1 Tax=Actinophytocola oryzae TaxID=502181 RepID=A0A4V3FV63_9PSEU|nr:hypothetical protein [Actinophytocola oryzae]TDV57731.1 hypothetical protein CLV71_101604 [Actinophytocola oryzae]
MSDTETMTALAGLREGLQSDGYDLVVEDRRDEVLELRVVATPEACDECLVPKDLMASVIMDSLPADLGVRQVALRYPTD